MPKTKNTPRTSRRSYAKSTSSRKKDKPHKRSSTRSPAKKSTKRSSTRRKSQSRSHKRSSTRSSASNKYIYFDNNGTTLLCNQAEKVMIKWLKCYNASSDFSVASDARKLLKYAQDAIHKHCETGGPDKYVVLFTSGGTESNCTVIRMIIEAYHHNIIPLAQGEIIPHLVTSSIEHHSILSCLHDLEENKRVEVTYVKPTIHGVITPNSVKEAIKENTCLVTIMYANNEIGTVNHIPEIAKITHEASNRLKQVMGFKFTIPFHTDAVQLFGKHRIKMKGDGKSNDIDALSMSFHKLYGPKGVGLLIIKKSLVDGFGINGIMSGSQQHGLRGGTENIAGIAGSIEALKHTFKNRTDKNKHLLKLKKLLIELLGKKYKFADYADYVDQSKDKDREPIELVLLGPPIHEKKVLPNTILLSIVKNKGKPFCNVKFKKKLNRAGVAVSIGSACLTGDKNSSHVIQSINAPDIIKQGVIRISLGDNNTETEIRKFVKIFNHILIRE